MSEKKATVSRRGARAIRDVLKNDVKRAEFFGAIANGMSQRDAAALIGTNEEAVRYFRKKSAAFAKEYATYLLVPKLKATKCIADHIGTNPQIATTFLARKYPNEWGQRKPDAIEPQKIAALLNQFIAHMFAIVPEEFHAAMNAQANTLLLGVMANTNEGDDDDG